MDVEVQDMRDELEEQPKETGVPVRPTVANFHQRFVDFDLDNANCAEGRDSSREDVMVLREELQLVAEGTRDRDLACHICVFGLMGHGKSRLLNLMLTALSANSERPNNNSAFRNLTGEAPPQDGTDASAAAAREMVRARQDVPSGDGSTTRAYARYTLPVATTQGRFPMYVVDTIGVKFSDELAPPAAEIQSEFSLIRSQLEGLDFRERVGTFKESHVCSNAYRGGFLFWPDRRKVGVSVATGEDIIDIWPEPPPPDHDLDSPHTASVRLRGGHVLTGVPFSKLHDPDGRSWHFTERGGFRDKRSIWRRIDHSLKGYRFMQPKCQAAILVINPLQAVPSNVFAKWREVFDDAGLREVPIVSTHSDLIRLLGPTDAPAAARQAQALLKGVNLNYSRFTPQHVSFVENYSGGGAPERRRWESERAALDSLVTAAYNGQDRMQGKESINDIATTFVLGLVGCFTAAAAFRRGSAALRRRFR